VHGVWFYVAFALSGGRELRLTGGADRFTEVVPAVNPDCHSMPRKIMRKRRRTVKKSQMIVGKVSEKLKTDFQAKVGELKWQGGESAFVRQCAEALLDQTAKGEEIAQPLRLLTVRQRRALDLLEFQQSQEGKNK